MRERAIFLLGLENLRIASLDVSKSGLKTIDTICMSVSNMWSTFLKICGKTLRGGKLAADLRDVLISHRPELLLVKD
jgi:hypothetical protein